MGRVNINMENIQAMFADPAGPVGEIIEKKTLNVEGIAKELLLIPGSGRTYTTRFYRGREGHPLGKTGRMQVPGKLYAWPDRVPHTASAPGLSPASDSGQLLASIGHEIVVEEVVTGRVHAHKRYALYLPRARHPRYASTPIFKTSTRRWSKNAMSIALFYSTMVTCPACGRVFAVEFVDAGTTSRDGTVYVEITPVYDHVCPPSGGGELMPLVEAA